MTTCAARPLGALRRAAAQEAPIGVTENAPLRGVLNASHRVLGAPQRRRRRDPVAAACGHACARSRGDRLSAHQPRGSVRIAQVRARALERFPRVTACRRSRTSAATVCPAHDDLRRPTGSHLSPRHCTLGLAHMSQFAKDYRMLFGKARPPPCSVARGAIPWLQMDAGQRRVGARRQPESASEAGAAERIADAHEVRVAAFLRESEADVDRPER